MERKPRPTRAEKLASDRKEFMRAFEFIKEAEAAGTDVMDGPLQTFGMWLGPQISRRGYNAESFAKISHLTSDEIIKIRFGLATREEVEERLPKIEKALLMPEGLLTQLLSAVFLKD